MKKRILRGNSTLSTELSWNTLSYSFFFYLLFFLSLCCFSHFSHFFFYSRSKLQPPCWCILKMIIHWDWASVAEHAQGSLITPAVIDKNKRSGEGRREARIPPSYNKEHSQIFNPPIHHQHRRRHPAPLTPSTAAVQPACREDSSILISLWERDILGHIDHSLLTAVINSDNSELNEKFYFCLSVPLLLRCIRCPLTPTLLYLVWHRCCPSPPPLLPNPTFKDLSLKWEPVVNRLICLAVLTVMAE